MLFYLLALSNGLTYEIYENIGKLFIVIQDPDTINEFLLLIHN